MSHQAISVRTYISVFVALMVLTIVTLIVAHIDLGRGNIYVAMAVAITKATLVVTYFMHLRYGTLMSRTVLLAGVLAIMLMMGLFLDDVLTRHTSTYLPYYGALNGVRPSGAPVPAHPPME